MITVSVQSSGRVEERGLAAVQTDEDTVFHCPPSVGATVNERHSLITCLMVSRTKREVKAKG